MLEKEWPELYRQYDEWLKGMNDDAVRADLTYQDMRGREWTQPVWKLLLPAVEAHEFLVGYGYGREGHRHGDKHSHYAAQHTEKIYQHHQQSGTS